MHRSCPNGSFLFAQADISHPLVCPPEFCFIRGLLCRSSLCCREVLSTYFVDIKPLDYCRILPETLKEM